VKLTDLTVKSLPIPPRGQKQYHDDTVEGFSVRVSQGGSKTFLVMIGRGKRFTIGRYGIITLAQARAAALRLKAQQTLGRVFPEAVTLSSAREQYLSQAYVRPNTREYYISHLLKLKAPNLQDITSREIIRILDRLPSATRTQALASFRPFFKWCIRRNYLDRSPCELLTAEKSSSRDRMLSDEELKAIWNACDCGTFGTIIKLLILTGARKNEIACIQT
jgi:integrase